MPTPPITHYKDDEPVDQATENLVNQELEKEVTAKAEPEKPVELKTIPVKKQEKPTNASNIVNMFRQKMSLTTIPIDLPASGKTIEFKEISAKEQKEISKVAMENDSRSDIMYCAMLSMINKLAATPGFDIRECTEFERIAVTLNLQQMNKLNPEIKFTCSKCGKENSYKLDTVALLKKFNKTYKPDMNFEIESGSKKYIFTVGWSKVRNIEDFFKNYYKKYDNSSKKIKESINNLSQIEYITMFLKKINVTEIADPEDSITANLEELTYPERVQIIDCLPQNIVFDDDTGIIGKVIETFVNPMNSVFKYHDCSFCGAEQTGAMANVTDFMGY